MKRHKVQMYSVIGRTWDGTGITAKGVADALAQMEQDCDGVDVFLNSPGGSIFEGTAIANELRRCGKPVDVFVAGIAASAASIIAMAGNRVVMEEGSWLMIHNSAGAAYGNRQDMAKMADTLGKIDAEIAAIYARRTGKTAKDIATMMDEETWLSASEAVKQGFADEAVCDPEEKKDAKNAISPVVGAFGYKHIPAEIAAMLEGAAPQARHSPEGTIWITPAASAGTSHGKEGRTMPPEVKAEKPEQPQAATVQEIKAALPDATDSFVVAQVTAGATLPQAKDAWMEALRAQNKALAADAEKAKSASAAAATVKPGVDPVASGAATGAEQAGNATERWHAAVEGFVAKGKTPADAVKAANRANPGLREEYLEEFSAGRK